MSPVWDMIKVGDASFGSGGLGFKGYPAVAYWSEARVWCHSASFAEKRFRRHARHPKKKSRQQDEGLISILGTNYEKEKEPGAQCSGTR